MFKAASSALWVWRWRQNCTVIRCCNRRAREKPRAQKNYYELLGVSVDSNAQEIKEAYRKLQKKYHPDIVGQQVANFSSLLNFYSSVLVLPVTCNSLNHEKQIEVVVNFKFQGHEYTLLLNKAYEVLMAEDQRRKYDESIGQIRLGFGEDNTPLGYSTWKGPLRPLALFVDENACIGRYYTH